MHSHESAMGVHVSPIWNPLLPPFPSHPSGLSQCTGLERPVSCIEPGLVIYFTYGNIHVSMLFSQIIPPSPSPTESKSLFFTSVSLLLSRIYGHHYGDMTLYWKLSLPVLLHPWCVVTMVSSPSFMLWGLEVGCISFSLLIATSGSSFSFPKYILHYMSGCQVMSCIPPILLISIISRSFLCTPALWPQSYSSFDSWQFQYTRRLSLHPRSLSPFVPPMVKPDLVITHPCMPSIISVYARLLWPPPLLFPIHIL